jgi:hypothetical protein
MVNREELIGTAEHVTLYARCRLNRCRYNRVRLYVIKFTPHSYRHVRQPMLLKGRYKSVV